MTNVRLQSKLLVQSGCRLTSLIGLFVFLMVLTSNTVCKGQTTFPSQIGSEVADRPTGFIDAFKDQGRLFIDSSGNPVPIDANGNPLSDGTAVIFDNRPVPEWLGYADDPSTYQPNCAGTYTISFQGQAVLSSVSGAPVLTFANQVYNASTNTTTVSVTLPGGATFANGPALMEINFTNTQLTATSAVNTGIANLQAIRPGFTLAQAADPTQVFDPAFVNAFAPFGYMRFMGWLGTNTSPGYYGDTGHHLLSWSSRSLPSDFYQGVGTNISTNSNVNAGAWGVSWEYVILLANATNKDIWINIPISATGGSDSLDPTYVASPDTSSYIYNLATLLKNGDAFTGNVGLKPGLHVYIEHSNEVWNSGFLQYTWNLLAAEDEVSKGGSVLNNDGDTSEYDWAYRRHIKRLYEIGQIFQSVFGPGSLNTTIRPVYAWWQLDEGSGSNAANALAWFKTTYGPPANYLYGMAQADYFNASNYASDTTIPEVLADMTTSSNASVQYVTAGKATASQYGLPLFAYEGGPANNNNGANSTTNIGVQILANRDPGMDTLVQNHIRNNWFGNGGSLYGYFGLSSAYSRYGDWGATDDYRNLTTAKYNALIDLTGYEPNGVPFAPGDLVAVAGNGAVALSWQAVPGAASYNVLRGTTPGGETLLTSSSSPTYSDTSAVNGTTYYYVVQGVNPAGTGASSNEASATPEAGPPPAPALTATAGNGQVVLTWSAAAGALTYNVYQGTTSGGENATPIATGVTATTYTISGLANGTTYYFEVSGVNTLGNGAVSNEIAIAPAGPPPAPTGLTAASGNGQAVLSWTASSGATSYKIYEGATSGGEGSTPIATGITATTYTVTGLTDGTPYFFTVAAVSAAGTSGQSNEAGVTPALPSALLAYEPFGEAAGPISTGCCDSSTGEGNAGGDFGWNNSVWTTNGSSSSTYDIASATPLTYPGLLTTGQYLTGGSGYTTVGRELDISSTGVFSSYLTSTTNGNEIGAPGQTIWMSFLMQMDSGDSLNDHAAVIPNPSATCCGGFSWYDPDSSIGIGYMGSLSQTNGTPYWSLQYNTNTNNIGSAPVIQTNAPMVPGTPALMVIEETFTATGGTVNLYVNPASLGGAAPSTPSATWTATTANYLGFQGLTYYGGDGSGQSAIADIRIGATYAAVTPTASAPPAAPTALTATAGNGQAALSWTPVTGATSYNVYEGTSSGGEGTTPIATGVTGASYTATGLTNGTAYYFEVAAVNGSGTSAVSNEASTTPVAPAPAAPTGLAASAGNGQATLTWTASSGATSYEVYQGTAARAESGTPVATGITATTYAVTGLTNGTAYFFTVAAVNGGGVSGYSNEATATPVASSSGTLVAYEPFGEPAGNLNGGSGGGDFGWGNNTWMVGNGAGVATDDSYDVATSTPLSYTGLQTTPSYVASAGASGDAAGRFVDTSANGAFSSYLISIPEGGWNAPMVGANGTTLWVSALARVDGSYNSADTYGEFLTNALYQPWATWSSVVGMGAGNYNANWGLLVNNSTVPSTVPVVAGQPALLVMEITFGATNTVNLYVNPTSLGGTAPGTPSATYTTTDILAFDSVALYSSEGYEVTNPAPASFTDLRFGTTFAAVTPVAAPAGPAAPTGLSATAGDGQVQLAWNASPGATSYQVWDNAGGSYGDVASSVSSTSYTVTGLTDGTQYSFYVTATNGGGTSSASNTVTATPSVPGPAAPTGLTGTAGNGQAALTWTASAGAASYNVYEGTATGAESTTPIATGITATTYTVSGLTNGTAYFFTVAAVNGAGASGYSNEASVTPVAPSNGTLLAYEPFGEATGALYGASGSGDSGWSAGWTEQSGSTAVPGYDVASTNPLTYPGLQTTGNYGVGGYGYQSAGRPLDVTASGPFSSYLANGLIGAPGQTLWISFLLRKDASDAETNSLSLTAQGGGSVWWANPANIAAGYFGAASNTGNTQYWSLQYGGTTIQSDVPVVVGTPALLVLQVTFGTTNVVNLFVNPGSLGGAPLSAPSATYSTADSFAFQGFSYYGGDGTGESSLDEIRVGTSFAAVTPQAVVMIPPAPSSLSAAPGNGQATLTWSAVAGATTYNVYQGATSGGEGTTPVATGVTSTNYTATGLTNGTTYYFEVAAVDSAGTGAVSNEASVTPSAASGIPAAPTLTATAGDMQATLSWSASAGASSYNVYQATTAGGEGTTPVATGVTGTAYTASGLTDETTYFFQVAAVNSHGTSGLSNEVSATPAPPVSGTNAPASFSIYPQVVAANPVNAGFNMQPAAGANITENAWIADGGFSPYDARMSFTASQDGTSTTFIATGGGGTSFYSSITTGYFVGATARTYRYSDGAWALLRTDTVSGYTALDDSSPADNTITFASSGPQILAGDIVWLDLDDQPTVPGLSLLDPRFTTYCTTWATETLTCDSRSATLPYTLTTDVPASDAGGLSLELADTNAETQGIWQYVQGAFIEPNYEEFQPGHTYKVDVWLKQSGISNGSVTFSINGLGISHTFTGVTDTWQEFTWTFPAVSGLPSGSGVSSVHLDFTAPGTMWVDNFQLYDAGWAPNTVNPQVMTAWQEYQPGTVRIWSNFGNAAENYSYLSLDSWLTPEIKTRNTPGIGNQYEVPAELEHLPDALANVKTMGSNPWLIVNMALSEVEWGELIDYLSAPAGTGYAAKRPANHPGPYTADFSTIYLEVGNEEWGTQQVPADAAYGQWAHFVLSNAIAGKSYFSPSKIKFVVDGFDLEPSFGSAAAAAAPEASVVDAALYTQGNQTLSGDQYYQSDLVQVPLSNGPIIDSIVAQQQLDAAAGRVYSLAAYEEGPGQDTAAYSGDPSLAAGIGAVDVNLYASMRGFGPQNLFMYQLGDGPYTTHTNFANGFRPHPVWEALQMRNNYTSGPMVLTNTNSVPTYSDATVTGGQAVPLIAVYSFQDVHVANQADVVVISRDLNNQTPVTLNFPATPTGSATLYTLTGDPRANNNESMNIPIGTETVSVSSSYTFTMPPGSMYIFQVPLSGTWSSTGQPTPPPPATLTAEAGNGEVTLTWPAASGATGYNVLRGTTPGSPYTQIGTSATVAYTDAAVTNGTTYYYVVQATNNAGASGNSPEASATPNVEDDSMTLTPPPLDGSNTGAWANAQFVPLSHYFSGASPDTAQYKTLWDNNYLYVLVSVQDPYLIAPTEANVYDGEAVELYFSGTDSKSTTYGPTDFQYAFPYGNGGAVVTEADHSPASLTGVLTGQQNIPGGFQIAMALPWTTLGTTPVLGQQYGFDVMVDTASVQGTRIGKLAWWATCDCTWDNPSNMGPLVLTKSAIQAQTVTFTAPTSPVTYGVTPITLSATATSGLSVTFSVLSGPGTVSGNTLTITGVGTVVVAANQAGNSGYSPAAQVTQSIVVNQANATVTLGGLNQTYTGSPLAVTATTTPAGLNITLTYSGSATAPTAAGNYAVSASVNDPDYQGSATGTLTIGQAALTIKANNATKVYGTANPTFGGSVAGAVGGDTFAESFSSAATVTSSVGTYAIVPSVSGTDLADYAQSVTNGALTVTQAATTTQLTVSSTSIKPGETVKITALVDSATTGTPTGTMSFYDGTTLLGTMPVSNGAASYTTSSLVAGVTHTLTATYSGDTNFSTSTSTSSVGVTVAPLDFIMTVSGPSSETVTPGSTITYQVKVTPDYGAYAGTVNFALTGLPPGATATFSPANIAANGGAQTVTVTIETAPATAKQQMLPRAGAGPLLPVALGVLLLGGIGTLRRPGRKLRSLMCIGFLLVGIAITASLNGCGNTNGFFGEKPQSYTITITASSGSLEHSATVTLIVE